jgi:hypothetical protein
MGIKHIWFLTNKARHERCDMINNAIPTYLRCTRI